MASTNVFEELIAYLDEHNPQFTYDEPMFPTEEDEDAEFEALWKFMLEDGNED